MNCAQTRQLVSSTSAAENSLAEQMRPAVGEPALDLADHALK
jgi:hypothetical protein